MSKPGSAAQTVKVRGPLFLRLFLLAPVILNSIIVFKVQHGHHPDPHFQVIWVLVLVLIIVPEFFLLAWFGLNLTPTNAVINNFRRRRVPWSRVHAVVQEPFMGGRRVVLWTDDGERIPLRAPVVDFTSIGARRFDRDFHTIGRWWLQHRGPNLQPPDWQPQAT